MYKFPYHFGTFPSSETRHNPESLSRTHRNLATCASSVPTRKLITKDNSFLLHFETRFISQPGAQTSNKP